MYRALPHGELAVLPGTSHLLLHEQPQLVTRLVAEFLTGVRLPGELPTLAAVLDRELFDPKTRRRAG